MGCPPTCGARAISRRRRARTSRPVSRRRSSIATSSSQTGIRTLRSVYADVDPTSRHGVIITEDVLGQGATFLDALSAYTPDQAAESLGQLATLHASTWGRAEYSRPTVARQPAARAISTGVASRTSWSTSTGRSAPVCPTKLRDAERLVKAYRVLGEEVAVAGALVAGPRRPAHRQRLSRRRRPAVVPRLATRAAGALVHRRGLPPVLGADDRGPAQDASRTWSTTTSTGSRPAVSTCPVDDVWPGVRRGIVHGFFLWAITLKVKPAITTELLTRLGTAVDDHDAFDVLGC